MANRKVKYSMMSAEDEEKINYLMPDIVLAVEALQLATADSIGQCLEECDIKTTPSQIMMALEYGCKLGLMEERTRYRLNPELTSQKNSFTNSSCPNKTQSRIVSQCCQPKKKELGEKSNECEEEEELMFDNGSCH